MYCFYVFFCFYVFSVFYCYCVFIDVRLSHLNKDYLLTYLEWAEAVHLCVVGVSVWMQVVPLN